jgi:hypothetical protein
MKKLLFGLLMLLVVSTASAVQLPDPVITVTEGEEYYTVDVKVEGGYKLRVFCDNLEIETPYEIERLDVEKMYIIRAFAQLYSEGAWSYSNVVEYYLYVPAKEDMPVPGPYPPGWIYFDVIEGEEYYTVLAYCEEDGFTVQLCSNGELVDNPYVIERSPEGDMFYEITACSQAEGYDIVTATMTLVVPALDEPLPGDMNSDGEVTIADVNAVIDAVMNQSSNEMYDFDGDGEVTISDVMALIDLVMSGQ